MSSVRRVSAAAVVVVVVIAAVISQAGLGHAKESKVDENNGGVLSLQEPRFRRSSFIGSSSGGRPLVEDFKKRSRFSSSSLSSSSDDRKRPTRSLEDASSADVSGDFLTPTGSDISGSLLHRVLRRAVLSHSQGEGQAWSEDQGRRSRRSMRPWSLYALTPYAAKQPSYELPRQATQPYGWHGTSWGRGFYSPASASFHTGRAGWGESEGTVEGDDVASSAWEEPYYQQQQQQQQQSPSSSRRFMAWGRHGGFMLG